MMDILKNLNQVADYIEANLKDKIDPERIAVIACTPSGSFMRFFSYMTGMSLKEYIRARRLSQAGLELREFDGRIIDLALSYGYDSADAFTRAFIRQHGITPTQARDPASTLRIYPPVSFHIMIKGAKPMNFRIIETKALTMHGFSKAFTGVAGDRFDQEHIMWADEHDGIRLKLSDQVPGIWYGLWDQGTYWIARPEEEDHAEDAAACTLPAGTYAVFTSGCGNHAGTELPRLRELIFGSWLPTSGYRQTKDLELEIYHLFPKDQRNKRYYELWIPVEKV